MTSAHDLEENAAPPETPAADPLLTPVEARKRAGVSHRTFQRYRAAGLITPAHHLPNGHARFRTSDVDAMVVRFTDDAGTEAATS